jgi:2,3-dihydroxybenzoate decarboxylase
MDQGRRNILKTTLALSLAVRWGSTAPLAGAATAVPGNTGPRGIISACEPFITSELAGIFTTSGHRSIADEPGFTAASRKLAYSTYAKQLTDIGDTRISCMQAAGVAKQVLALVSPGVQVFKVATGTALARSCNDQLAEACRNHPDRYAGLAVLAVKDPHAAAMELDRGINRLGLKGAVINPGHNDFLDQPDCNVIFEAAESLDAPLYIAPVPMIHPAPAQDQARPSGGYSALVYLHLLAIIKSGVFDRYPGLRIVAGNPGDGLADWLARVDRIQRNGTMTGMENRYPGITLQKRISAYVREHIYFTIGSLYGDPVIRTVQAALGADRLLYSMDHPARIGNESDLAAEKDTLNRVNSMKFYRDNARQVFSI